MNSKTIIFIYGLPGSGKTTLARTIQAELQSPWFNADRVRQTLSSDIGFSLEDRSEQARRMAALALLALDQPGATNVIVDFVCPTMETHSTFMSAVADYTTKDLPVRVVAVFMNTIAACESHFKDTAALATYNIAQRNPDFIFSSRLETPADWLAASNLVCGRAPRAGFLIAYGP